MIYSFRSRVRYSELDQKGRLSLPALINYFQDCSTFQSEAIGLGMDVLKEERRAWFLSYWQIVVEELPQLGEEILISTRATKFKGLYGNRNFSMEDQKGRRAACANSVWVFMDLEKGRPARPKETDILPYGVEEPLEMDYEDRKIALPGQCVPAEPFSVKKHHIDTNGHVNNCQYVQMALELLPDDFEVHQVRVDYKKSAILGNQICPATAKEPDRQVVELLAEDGTPYAVIEFKQKQMKKGDNR